jgi:hypothetical protein
MQRLKLNAFDETDPRYFFSESFLERDSLTSWKVKKVNVNSSNKKFVFDV